MNILVFDIETIPDFHSARRVHKLKGLSDAEVVEFMLHRRRQQTEGSSDFLPQHCHAVVAISLLLRDTERLSLWSLGEPNSNEAEIVQRFFDGIERYTPMLVSWNGSGFDLPVLHYRALLHQISAPRYWETGSDDRSFKWNNYINRFHDRHTDLMDVIAGYQNRAFAPLTEVATMLGFPGKMGMSGGQVWEHYLKNDIQAVRHYCEVDVLNTYLIFLRYELMRGYKTPTSHERECQRLRDMLQQSDKAHWQEFLAAWE